MREGRCDLAIVEADRCLDRLTALEPVIPPPLVHQVLRATGRRDARSCTLELIVLYHERWEVELVYDEGKTHLDPRRATKPAHLRSGTPAGVRQELYAVSLGHFVVRAVMVQAAALTGLDTDRLSFTGCLET